MLLLHVECFQLFLEQLNIVHGLKSLSIGTGIINHYFIEKLLKKQNN